MSKRYPNGRYLYLAIFVLPALLGAGFGVSSNAGTTAQKPIRVHAEGRGKPRLSLRDGYDIAAEYTGPARLVEALKSEQVEPLTLASEDFDRDGAPDLAVGYGHAGRGIVTLQRGSKLAYAPGDAAVYRAIQQGEVPASLEARSVVVEVPEAPDYLVVGDFNGDGWKDLLAGARGGGLHLLSGTGAGGFGEARRVTLPGRLSALAAGEFGRADGILEVAAGIEGPEGAAVLIYEGASGGLSSRPAIYGLAYPAVSLGFGVLGEDAWADLAVAAGKEVVIIHGQEAAGGSRQQDAQLRMEHVEVPFAVRELALGNFIWDRAARVEMALLSWEGSVQLLVRKDLDTRPFTAQELEARALRRRGGQVEQARQEAVGSEWRPEAEGWSLGQRLEAAVSSSGQLVSRRFLVRARISPRPQDDLLLIDEGRNQLDIIQLGGSPGSGIAGSESALGSSAATVRLDVEGAPVAVLAMPRKVNGERELLLLRAGQTAVSGIIQAPLATITVDRTDDTAAAKACTAAANDCSLRGAVIFANAAPGTTINIPAGSYQLTIPGGAGYENNAAQGDLDITANMTSLVGAGAASTIIQQTAAGVRVIEDNPGSIDTHTFSISGVTLTGGSETGGFGGGGLRAGGIDNVVTVTDCVIKSNACPISACPGGGIYQVDGNLTVTGTVIGGPLAGDGNTSNSYGGGIAFEAPSNTLPGDPFPITGSLTLTNSTVANNSSSGVLGGGGLYAANGVNDQITGITFSGNKATNASGRGGAIFYASRALSIKSSTFDGNQAQGTSTTAGGGAIHSGSGTMTINTSRFTNNSVAAGAKGGAINVEAGVTANVNFNRFIGNTAGTAANGKTIRNAGSTNADNNWWGINTGPGASDAVGTTPGTWLQLRHSAASSTILPNASTGLTADLYGRNSGGAVGGCPGAGCSLNGLPAFPSPAGTIFSNAVRGTLSGAGTQYVNGQATATYTAGSTAGAGSADATADGQNITAIIAITQAGTLYKLYLPLVKKP